jgi:Tol biopolymer transport system component
LLYTTNGDFIIETSISGPKDGRFQSGGLIIWKDEENFIRFERGTWGSDTIILQKNEQGVFGHLADDFLQRNPTYLRIERRERNYTAKISDDGKSWKTLSLFAFSVSDPLKVGLDAICLEVDSPPTVTNFDYFKVIRIGNETPYIMPSQRRLNEAEKQKRQKAAEEKLLQRAREVLSETASERSAFAEKTVVTDPKTGLKFRKIFSDEKLDVIARSYWLTISPDGKFLFSPLGPKSDISGWVVPLKEGEYPFKPAPEIVGGIHGSWSPDMSKFAFVSVQTGDLYVMPISPETGQATGPAKKFIEGIGEEYQNSKSASSPSWSLDGKRIAFSWGKNGNFDIWTIPAEGGDPTQITNDPRWERWPVWSSDGKNIVFGRMRELTQNSAWDVWMVSSEGGTSVRIIEDAYGILSPNGKWFVFKRWKEGEEFGILRLSDNRQFNIIPPEEVGNFFAWSHKENKLLFYKSGRKYHSALKVVPAYGGPSVELGKDVELWADTQNWSSDGKVIVTGGEEGFWIIPAVGGTPVKLKLETNPKLDMYPFLPFSPDLKKFAFLDKDRSLWVAPVSIEEKWTTGPAVKIAEKIKLSGSTYIVSWSPDSKMIAFSSWKSGNADIWTASAEEGKLKRLTDDPEDETDPVWSPDGEMIAYSRGKALWIVSASGDKPREVAKEGSSPTWSPDGKELSFIEGDSAYISIMTLATGQVRRILDLKAFNLKEPDAQGGCWNLIWSPDGKRLAFLSHVREKCHVWVVPVAGGEPMELASDDAGGKFYLYWSPDSRKLSYNSDRMVKVGMGAIWEADVEELMSREE